MGILNSLDSWLDTTIDRALDTTLDAAKSNSENVVEAEEKNWNDKAAQEAHHLGVADADHDMQAGTANTLDNGGHDVSGSFYAVLVDHPGDADSVHLPDTMNPFIAAVEVALTPTEIGEKAMEEAQHQFQDDYHEAYKEESIRTFDHELEQHLQPDPDAWESPAEFTHSVGMDVPNYTDTSSPNISSDTSTVCALPSTDGVP